MSHDADQLGLSEELRGERERAVRALVETQRARAAALAEREAGDSPAVCVFRTEAAPRSWTVGRAIPEPTAGGESGCETRIDLGSAGSKRIVLVLWSARPLTATERSAAEALARPLARCQQLAETGSLHARDRAFLQTILSTLVDAVLTIDQDGIVLSANQATERLLGYAESELVGRNVSILMPEPDASQHDGYVARYLRTGQAKIIGLGREVFARRADGSVLPIRLSVSEVTDEGRRYFTGILSDISERKRAEQSLRDALTELRGSQAQLIQAEKMSALGKMVAGVAHELNNPMMSILTFAQYCAKRTEAGDRRLEVLEGIERETLRCVGIVRGLLDFSRTGTLAQGTKRAEDLAEIVRRAVELFSHRLSKEQVKVTAHLDLDLPKLWVCADEIEQILVNVLSNALDALRGVTGREGELRIAVERQEDRVRLVLEDNGPGIDPATLTRIFDPFFTTKPVGTGTGLGLSISQGIARAHGGDLRLQSAEGLGARVELDLPIARGDELENGERP